MRIGIVTPFAPEIFTSSLKQEDYCAAALPSVQSLVHSFLQNGHFVRIFTFTAIDKTYKEPNLEVYSIEAGFRGFKGQLLGIVPTLRLKSLVKHHVSDLDVVHAQWSYETATAAMSVCHRLPVFHTIRDWAPTIYQFIPEGRDKELWALRKRMVKRVLNNKDIHTIANSKYTHDLIQKDYGYDVPIIPNSVSDQFLLSTERQAPHDCSILCVTTNFDKRKNVETLVKAFSSFLSQKPDAKLTIITKYPEEQTIANWRAAGLLRNVNILTNVAHSELIKYYDAAAFFVTPSKEETFGNTVIESLARQVPVIGGEASGAIPWVLGDGSFGYLCDINSHDSLLQTMLFVCDHPTEASQKALDGYEHVKEEFSEQAIYKKHIDLYQKYVRR
jgi:glycosyltransferase involved in cell wall biosynthesis